MPTRGWELLIGAFAAFYLSQANPKEYGKGLSEVAGWLGVALILYAVFAHSKNAPSPGSYALVPTFGTVLIILFATQQTTVGKFVGNKAFVGIGLISYSAYLWHQPLFAFARHRSLTEQSNFIFLVLTLFSLVLAYGSWRMIEIRFRNKDLFSRRFVFSFSAIGTAFFISFGLVGHFHNEELTSLRFSENQILTIASASPSPKRPSCHFPQVDEALERMPCTYFSDNVRVAVFGNSHAT